jgi:hypothetical protein
VVDDQFTEDSGVADFNEQVWRVLRERGHNHVTGRHLEGPDVERHDIPVTPAQPAQLKNPIHRGDAIRPVLFHSLVGSASF